MKNQYFGDINDYRKYGLLRVVSSGLRLRVCWMLTPDDGRQDGKFVRYLARREKWRAYDPSLFDLLHRSVCVEKKRSVEQVERLSILPSAIYWGSAEADYSRNRNEYFASMERQFASVDLVFFDPDNGLEVRSVPVTRKDSSKYLYWCEIEKVFRLGCSIIIYQHFPREKRGPYIARMKSELKNRLRAAAVFAFRTSRVVFLLAAQKCHVRRIRQQVDNLRLVWPEKQIRSC